MSAREKARRAANFLDFEQEILLDIVSKYLYVLRSKKRDHVSHKEKDDIWHRIADEFNTVNKCHQPREYKVLRLKYDNIKKTLKRKLEDMTPLNCIEIRWMNTLNNAACNRNQQYSDKSVSSTGYGTMSFVKPEIELTEGEESNWDWSNRLTPGPVQPISPEQFISTNASKSCKVEELNVVRESLNTNDTSQKLPIEERSTISNGEEIPRATNLEHFPASPGNRVSNEGSQTGLGCKGSVRGRSDLEDAKLELIRLQIEMQRAQLKWLDKLNDLKATSLQLDIDKKMLELEMIRNTN